MAWIRERGALSVTPFVPVIGPRTTRHLDDYPLEVALTDEQYTRLPEVSAVPLGVPHESNEGNRARLLGVPHESNGGNRARLLGGDSYLAVQGPAPVA
ncbi:hypothetical protein ACWDE0_27315 [Streptomyces sp. 900105755]|uniref:hypothetical protein n=1 Tax=Streptomyces sp. 900105755 TaxID=3154389 RepID=UPI00331E0857